MKQSYAQHYRELWNRHWWWQSRRKFVLKLLKEIGQNHEIRRILDVGCGDGLFFDDLMGIAPTWGIESDGLLLTATNPYRDRIDVGPFGHTANAARRYDLIVMLDVLEHIEDDAAAINTLAACLEPGGYAVITVPALPVLWSAHDEANQHYRRYSRTALRNRLEDNGLKVERLDYYFLWTTLPLLLRKWLHPAESTGAQDYHVDVPSEGVNRLLLGMSDVDHLLARHLHLPIGSSLFAICRRA